MSTEPRAGSFDKLVASGQITDAAALGFGTRLAQESLLAGISRLEQVLSDVGKADPWYAEVREAIRSCTLAVEHDLDSLDGAGGMKDRVRRSEPRLLPSLEQLENALAKVLIEAWEAKDAAAQAQIGLARRLSQLSAELRSIVDREFDIAHTELIAPGGEG